MELFINLYHHWQLYSPILTHIQPILNQLVSNTSINPHTFPIYSQYTPIILISTGSTQPVQPIVKPPFIEYVRNKTIRFSLGISQEKQSAYPMKTPSGGWLTYPSEKYESVGSIKKSQQQWEKNQLQWGKNLFVSWDDDIPFPSFPSVSGYS